MSNVSHLESIHRFASGDFEPVKAHVFAENEIMIGPSGDFESTDTRRMMMVDVPRRTRSRVNFNSYEFTEVQFTDPAQFANDAHHAPDHFRLTMVNDDW